MFVEWFRNRYGEDVLWVDPYSTRLPSLEDLQRIKHRRKIAASKHGKQNFPDWLTVLCPYALPIEPLSGANMLNFLLWRNILLAISVFIEKGECLICIGKPSNLALSVLDRYSTNPSLYDAMDDFSAFYKGMSRSAMEKKEQKVASRVTRISVSSTFLAERFADYHEKLVLAHNACSAKHLPSINEPVKQQKRPVLGYIGTIGHWFDWSLLCALAENNPTMCVRLIGPLYASPPMCLPLNVELSPACDHVSAISAMQGFSVGLIPFKLTDLTASVDPIKYYEYRAIGLPILSTRFGEMALRESQKGVFLVDKCSDLEKQVKEALTCSSEITEIQEFRKANTWDVRFNSAMFEVG
jgi:hypothetical protein